MIVRLLADAVLALHAAFILFVVAGGVLVLWRRGIALFISPPLPGAHGPSSPVRSAR